MSLTNTDYEFLKRNGRRFRMTRKEAAATFDEVGLPQEDWLLEFQSSYAGYCPETGLVYGIVSPSIEESGEPRIDSHENKRRVRIDLENSTQVRYWLREDGVVCFEDNEVAESFVSYIRFAAYCCRIFESPKWTYIDGQRRTTKKYTGLLQELEGEIVPEVSDRWHRVSRSDAHIDIRAGRVRKLYMSADFLSSMR